VASQSVIHPVPQQKSAVVVSIPKPSPQSITQCELALYRSLRARFEQLEAQLTTAQEDLKARLVAGAAVEAGNLVAFLDERSRRNVAWRSVASDLADTVFGQGNGETYCQEILNATTPTITTTLVVR